MTGAAVFLLQKRNKGGFVFPSIEVFFHRMVKE
jgi:hypothetical protein